MKLKIKTSSIKYGFFLLLYFRPASYIIGKTVDNICLALVCALTVYFTAESVIDYKQGKYHPTWTTFGLIAFFGWCMVGSTFLNYFVSKNVSFMYAITTFLCELGIIIVSDRRLEQNPKQYLKLFISIGGFFSLVNALTMFAFGHSGGLNAVVEREGRSLSGNYFFFAEDNATFFLVWPVIVLTWIYYFRFVKTKTMLLWAVFFTAVSTGSYVYMWSVNNIIGCLATIGLVLFYFRRMGRRKAPAKKKHAIPKFDLGWILAVVFNYLIVVAQIFLRYSDFIVNTLHKSITLGGRVTIWNNCLRWIMEQPLIGFGYETRSVTLSKIIFNHAHNIMLEILYRGGLIGMVLFIVVMITAGRKVSKNQQSGEVAFLGWCVVLFILLCSMEFAFYRYPYILLFVLLGRCQVLVKQGTDSRGKLCRSPEKAN